MECFEETKLKVVEKRRKLSKTFLGFEKANNLFISLQCQERGELKKKWKDTKTQQFDLETNVF